MPMQLKKTFFLNVTRVFGTSDDALPYWKMFMLNTNGILETKTNFYVFGRLSSGMEFHETLLPAAFWKETAGYYTSPIKVF